VPGTRAPTPPWPEGKVRNENGPTLAAALVFTLLVIILGWAGGEFLLWLTGGGCA
jgi:hypothetical protein